MKDELFDTKEKINQGISDLRSGLNTPFWNLICKILDGNIEVAKEQLENGTGEGSETPESIARIRDRLRIYREVRNTPEDLIKKLETGEEEHPDPDPFATVADAEVDKAE